MQTRRRARRGGPQETDRMMPTRMTFAAPLVALLLAAAPAGAQAPGPAKPAAPRPPAAAPAAPSAPAGDMVTEANIAKPLMKAIYDQAKMPTEIDAAGNLLVKGGQMSAYVLPVKDNFRLLVTFTFQPKATLAEKFDLANRINEEYIVARAFVGGENNSELRLDYYVLVGPGLSRAQVVSATKRFLEVASEAVPAMDTERLIK